MTAITRSPGAGWSRAARPGFGRARAATIVAFAVLFGLLGYGIYGHVASHTSKIATPNGLSADHLLVGTYATPAITVAGDDVRVQTPSFSAMAVVTGPLVPGEGFTYQPQYVTGTWTVHIWDVKGNIPLAAADFDNVDHTGTEYKLEPPQGTTMPKAVSTGGQATFQLRAVVPIGEDLFRWAPNGNNVVAKWDNQVEND